MSTQPKPEPSIIPPAGSTTGDLGPGSAAVPYYRVDENFNSWYNHAIVIETQGNRKIILDPIKGLIIDGIPFDPNGGGDGTPANLPYWVKPNSTEFDPSGTIGFADGAKLDNAQMHDVNIIVNPPGGAESTVPVYSNGLWGHSTYKEILGDLLVKFSNLDLAQCANFISPVITYNNIKQAFSFIEGGDNTPTIFPVWVKTDGAIFPNGTEYTDDGFIIHGFSFKTQEIFNILHSLGDSPSAGSIPENLLGWSLPLRDESTKRFTYYNTSELFPNGLKDLRTVPVPETGKKVPVWEDKVLSFKDAADVLGQEWVQPAGPELDFPVVDSNYFHKDELVVGKTGDDSTYIKLIPCGFEIGEEGSGFYPIVIDTMDLFRYIKSLGSPNDFPQSWDTVTVRNENDKSYYHLKPVDFFKEHLAKLRDATGFPTDVATAPNSMIPIWFKDTDSFVYQEYTPTAPLPEWVTPDGALFDTDTKLDTEGLKVVGLTDKEAYIEIKNYKMTVGSGTDSSGNTLPPIVFVHKDFSKLMEFVDAETVDDSFYNDYIYISKGNKVKLIPVSTFIAAQIPRWVEHDGPSFENGSSLSDEQLHILSTGSPGEYAKITPHSFTLSAGSEEISFYQSDMKVLKDFVSPIQWTEIEPGDFVYIQRGSVPALVSAYSLVPIWVTAPGPMFTSTGTYLDKDKLMVVDMMNANVWTDYGPAQMTMFNGSQKKTLEYKDLDILLHVSRPTIVTPTSGTTTNVYVSQDGVPGIMALNDVVSMPNWAKPTEVRFDNGIMDPYATNFNENRLRVVSGVDITKWADVTSAGFTLNEGSVHSTLNYNDFKTLHSLANPVTTDQASLSNPMVYINQAGVPSVTAMSDILPEWVKQGGPSFENGTFLEDTTLFITDYENQSNYITIDGKSINMYNDGRMITYSANDLVNLKSFLSEDIGYPVDFNNTYFYMKDNETDDIVTKVNMADIKYNLVPQWVQPLEVDFGIGTVFNQNSIAIKGAELTRPTIEELNRIAEVKQTTAAPEGSKMMMYNPFTFKYQLSDYVGNQKAIGVLLSPADVTNYTTTSKFPGTIKADADLLMLLTSDAIINFALANINISSQGVTPLELGFKVKLDKDSDAYVASISNNVYRHLPNITINTCFEKATWDPSIGIVYLCFQHVGQAGMTINFGGKVSLRKHTVFA